MKSSSAAQIIEGGLIYMDVAKMSLFSHCWCDRILHRWHSLWLQTGIHYRGHQRGHPNNATSQDKDKDPLHSFSPTTNLVWFGTFGRNLKMHDCDAFFESCLIASELNTDTLDQNHTFPKPHMPDNPHRKLWSDSQHMRRETSRKHVGIQEVSSGFRIV